MGERGATGGAWGARDEASWWSGGAGDLQNQQQIADEVARSTAAATHQLFTYKMTGGFSNSTGDTSTPAYDYRLMTGNTSREDSPQQQWWYSTNSVESQQPSSPTQNQSSPEASQNSGAQQNQQVLQQQQNQELQRQLQQRSQQQTIQQTLQQQNQQQALQQAIQQHSQQQSLQHTLQQNQQTLQQMLQQQQQQNQQQTLQQSLQQQQQQPNQQPSLQQSIQQTLQVSQVQAQALVQAQQVLQQVQAAQSLQQQQQTLQEHIQAVQQQHIQAALQRQSATLQELQQQAQQQAILANCHTVKGRMPRARSDNKPRGRMTAYAFFVQTCREEHKRKHPDENVIFAAFSKKCAERWNTMLEKEKQRFHEMAEQDKKRYDLEMQTYVPPRGEKIGRGRKRKQVKDPNAPKRSLSAFFWFCNDERGKVKAGNPEYTMGETAKELGRRWAAAEPEIKSKYEALSEQDKARYDREMTAYKKGPLVMQAQVHTDELDDDGDLDGEVEYE